MIRSFLDIPFLLHFKVLFLQCVREGDFFCVFESVLRRYPIISNRHSLCLPRGKSDLFFIQRGILRLMVITLGTRRFEVLHIYGFQFRNGEPIRTVKIRYGKRLPVFECEATIMNGEVLRRNILSGSIPDDDSLIFVLGVGILIRRRNVVGLTSHN